jgi:hypothetical protein
MKEQPMNHFRFECRRIRLSMAIAIAVVAMLCGVRGVTADALYWRNWAYEARTLTGIELAVGRHYSSGAATELGAYAFRFDSEANAQAGLEAMDTNYIEADSSRAGNAIEIGEFGLETRAYASESELFGSSASILVVDGRYVYIAAVLTYETGFDMVGLSTAMIQSMMATEAGEGPGEFDPEGASTGGLWNKLPTGDSQMPVDLWVIHDEQFYPADTSDDPFDFAAYEGAQRAIARLYAGDAEALSTPETAPPGTYIINVLVAEFDTAEHAAASFETVYKYTAENTVAEFSTDDFPLTTEEVDPGDLGDQAKATLASGEDEGLSVELPILVVQDGRYLYVIFAIAVGENAGSLETAGAVIEAMVDAPAGSGDEAFDAAGSSTGGLWDKLPAAGNEALGELEPEEDSVLYP